MKEPSGKFVLRVDPQLHAQLRDEAESQSLSLNQWIVAQLQKRPTTLKGPELQLVEEIKKVFGDDLLGVVLFGSAVRQEVRSTSDIDILIVLDHSHPINRTLYQVWDAKICPIVGARISPQFSHRPSGKSPSSLWLEIAMEGEILFDKKNIIKKELRKIRERIAFGEFVRKLSHGHPYWVHQKVKPDAK